MTHERAPVKSLAEIETSWSVDDLLDANLALDVWDELERKSYDKAKREARERAR